MPTAPVASCFPRYTWPGAPAALTVGGGRGFRDEEPASPPHRLPSACFPGELRPLTRTAPGCEGTGKASGGQSLQRSFWGPHGISFPLGRSLFTCLEVLDICRPLVGPLGKKTALRQFLIPGKPKHPGLAVSQRPFQACQRWETAGNHGHQTDSGGKRVEQAIWSLRVTTTETSVCSLSIFKLL